MFKNDDDDGDDDSCLDTGCFNNDDDRADTKADTESFMSWMWKVGASAHIGLAFLQLGIFWFHSGSVQALYL